MSESNPQHQQDEGQAGKLVRITDEQAEEMRQLAEENERSLAAEVRLAVRQYLERKRQERAQANGEEKAS